MAASRDNLPSREEELVLHRRLLEMDAVAPAELAEIYYERLIDWLVRANSKKIPSELCVEAAGLSFMNLVKKPSTYNPGRGKGLFAYLRMSAKRDFQSLDGQEESREPAGLRKLLDAWVAPDDAGDPVGCMATSFTFTPAFFEEECLARFLQLESDPTEDGPVYLVEREEKLAQLTCAAALVDQHHCRGSRSLRWDFLPARMPPASLLHAKVSLLFWSRLIRIIIASANLTEDGYRRNQEVFGVVDFKPEGESPLPCLIDTIAFLRQAGLRSQVAGNSPSPALGRWNALLDRAIREGRGWGVPDEETRRDAIRVRALFSGPGYPSVFETLRGLWPGGAPPSYAAVVSPFFDRPDVPNQPASELWKVLRQRGEASVEFYVAAEEVPGGASVFLFAPRSLLDAQPGRETATTDFYRVLIPPERPLHAKGIWLEDERWIVYAIGSSNFTSAGTGLGKASNLEANLVYVVDAGRDGQAKKLVDATFPEGQQVDLDGDVKWEPRSSEGEDEVGEEILLPAVFAEAVYDCDDKSQATVTLSFAGEPPASWELVTDGESQRFLGESEWQALGRPTSCKLPWDNERPPSGFWVRWAGSVGRAWWPINVLTGNALPPPAELKNLPLEVLINILSSARPLHRVLGEYLRRRAREKSSDGTDKPVVDPHKRVDTSRFLLQRTRRISWALNALRKRLERPAVTLEFLRWRLRGPVGVLALAKSLEREAQSDEEKAFLISELILELARVKPQATPGCLPPAQHLAEIRALFPELKSLVPGGPSGPENLRRYVESVFAKVGV